MAEWVLIGADGMLGRCWEQLLDARSVEHVATSETEACDGDFVHCATDLGGLRCG
jgi:hypothetical protein